MKLRNISCSLTDILGADYMEAVQSVATTILGVPEEEANRLANEKIDFFPESYVKKMDELAEKTGEKGYENMENRTISNCRLMDVRKYVLRREEGKVGERRCILSLCGEDE